MNRWNNRIGMKLASYFIIALVGLSLVIGILFTLLLRNHTIDVHKADLEKRAIRIAATLSDFDRAFNTGGAMKGGYGGGYGVFIRFIGEIAGADVWVIDQGGNLLMSNIKSGQHTVSVESMPQNANAIINKVFEDKTVFSEAFTPLLASTSLTVGTPVHDNDNQVVAAVLLHTPVDSIYVTLWQGIKLLLFSMLIAMLLAFCASFYLSFLFTRPLKIMKNQALKMAKGDFGESNQIHQNDEIGELAVTLNTLSGQLEEADALSKRTEQLRRDFVASISHELRTPITSIRGSLEAICDGVVTDSMTVANYHGNMLKEVIHLQRLVGDLLELSKLQNADFPIKYETLSIVEVIDSAVLGIRSMAIGKQIRLDVSLGLEDSQDKDMFKGDFDRLRQMIMIVLDNAVKYSPEGAKVTVDYSDRTLTIEDQGMGIRSVDLEHIFEKFYRSEHTNDDTGTGLGLAIAKQIADRHGISIYVNSEPGHGTRFKFDFKE